MKRNLLRIVVILILLTIVFSNLLKLVRSEDCCI